MQAWGRIGRGNHTISTVETKKGLFIGRGFEGLIPTLPPPPPPLGKQGQLKWRFWLNCDYQSIDFDPQPQDHVASLVYEQHLPLSPNDIILATGLACV